MIPAKSLALVVALSQCACAFWPFDAQSEVPAEVAAEARANLTGVLGLDSQFVTVNRSVLGYGAGAVLAGTFLTAAVIKNLPEDFSLFGGSLAHAQERSELDFGAAENEDERNCNCRDWCAARSYGYLGRSKRYFRDLQTQSSAICNFPLALQCKKCGMEQGFFFVQLTFHSFLTQTRTFVALRSLSISSPVRRLMMLQKTEKIVKGKLCFCPFSNFKFSTFTTTGTCVTFFQKS